MNAPNTVQFNTKHPRGGSPLAPETEPLTAADIADLEARWIDPATAEAAGIARVTSAVAAGIIGRPRKHGDPWAGLVIPYRRPGETAVHERRLRRDRPDLEPRPDGKSREIAKYLSPPGRPPLIYFPPMLPADVYGDVGRPLIVTEGEFKALALARLALHVTAAPRFASIGLQGVWSWRGVVGKTEGPRGDRCDVRGPLPDLDQIGWTGRRVIVAFDADAEKNDSVAAAQAALARELRRRGAVVAALDWPAVEGKGIDDLLAKRGPEHVLELIGGIDWGGAEAEADAEADKQSLAARAVELLRALTEALYTDSDGETVYADVRLDSGVRATYALESSAWRRWAQAAVFGHFGRALGREAMSTVRATVEALAARDGGRREVFLRVGRADGKLYIDLADEAWRAVEIDADGWRVISDPPVRFRRAKAMLPLPEPARGGSLDDLRLLLNVRSESDLRLIAAWLLASFQGGQPYPLLSLTGEQGSAKSTAARVLRSLIDPSDAPLRALPHGEDALLVHATNTHVVALDNVSGLSAAESDALCRLSTGAGLSKRTLYSDAEETILKARRPIVLNGIVDAVTRPDLADRTIAISLDPIPAADRKTEAELRARLEAAAPRILGALLDAAAHGLRRLPEVRLDTLPRMADFATWATACGDGKLWPAGGFAEAYDGNRAAAVDELLATDPVGAAVRTLADGEGLWSGTASDLLAALADVAGEKAAKQRDWPATPRKLSAHLRRVAPPLRQVGVSITFEREGRASRARLITLAAQRDRGTPSTPSKTLKTNGETVDGIQNPTVHNSPHTVHFAREVDGTSKTVDGMKSDTVQDKPNGINTVDGVDGVDGVSRLYGSRRKRRYV